MYPITSYTFFQKLCSLPFVDEIWLFGSRARGDNQERSDIDIAIICPRASNNDWLQVTEIRDNADTLLKIDCIRFDILKDNNPFKAQILQDKKILYRKE